MIDMKISKEEERLLILEQNKNKRQCNQWKINLFHGRVGILMILFLLIVSTLLFLKFYLLLDHDLSMVSEQVHQLQIQSQSQLIASQSLIQKSNDKNIYQQSFENNKINQQVFNNLDEDFVQILNIENPRLLDANKVNQVIKRAHETLAQRRQRLIKQYRQRKAKALLDKKNVFVEKKKELDQKKIDQKVPEKVVNKPQQIFPEQRQGSPQLNDYPMKASSKPQALRKKYVSINQQNMKQANLSLQSYNRAISYIKLGLQSPSAQLIQQQKTYMENKYNLSKTKQELPICVVIPSYNNEKNKRYKFNLKTILDQEYSNYHIVYIDDCSTDNTSYLVQDYLNSKKFPKDKFIIIYNQQKAGKLYGERMAAVQFCKPHQLYFLIDGDDGLSGVQIFKLFNHLYQQNSYWFLYGNYVKINYGVVGSSRNVNPLSLEQNKFRSETSLNSQLQIGHLTTFYNELFLKVPQSDLMYPDSEQYFVSQTDRAVVYPMIEMMGDPNRFFYLPEIVYLYNDQTQLSIENVNKQSKAEVLKKIISFKSKDKLQCLFKDEKANNCIQPRKYALNQKNKSIL